MPHLQNGIGTWYIGKKNFKQADGKCEFCGSWGKLSSYETRLWILVLFVPVAPLGKKQILDDCPRCRRHRHMPLAKWKELEANALRERMQQAEAHPDDPQAMLELHGTMIGFRRTQEAQQLAEVMQADFPDNFDVQMHLGTWHASEGRADKARPFFRRALDLEPENLFAKQMVALECIDAGDLPRTGELLRGMDAPGPNQAPRAMLALADAYQARGEHANALEIYRTVLRMAPSYAQDKSLRGRIRGTEQALGVTETSLPKMQRKLGKWHALAAVLAAAVVGALGFNFYQARNQPLFIVNGLGRTVGVSIDGGAAIDVAPQNRREIALAEGGHRAVIRQPGEPDEAVEFRVENGFFERFTDRSAFVLNPGGAAVILWEVVEYFPQNQRPPQAAASPYRIHFGDRSFAFHDIDYAFKQPPQQLKTEKNTGVVSKTVLSVLSEDPMVILHGFPDGTPPATLADFTESQLKQHANDNMLLRAYLSFRAAANQLDRCREFLAGGLATKPLAIEWHRTYQQVCEMTGRQTELEAEYRKKLAADPHDSALLYLTGRVVADAKEQRRDFEQAVEADRQNAYPQYALAYDYASAGDFPKALPLAQEACRLKPDHTDMESLLYDVRFALQQYGPLEQELRQKRAEHPFELQTVGRLMQVQAARGAGDQARAVQKEYARQFEENNPFGEKGDPGQLALQSKLMLFYLENDLRGILSEGPALRNPLQAAGETFAAHLELGNLADAETALTSDSAGKVSEDGALLLSLGWRRKGEHAKAEQWRKKALESLRAGSAEQKQAAAILESGKIDRDELDGLVLIQASKAIWLAALADECAEHRKELLDYAEKLNTDTYFPHRFLKRAIEEMRSSKPEGKDNILKD